jgi:7-carboxy-7-deazaguanine synthase (Cx14CxxC type)
VSYAVKEIFYTLQGEGAHTGRAAVFLRFSGCNLWSGRKEDRARGLGGCSRWCDTDFVGTDGTGGGSFTAPDQLARHVAEAWLGPSDRKFVVCTGGEPLLQLDEPLIAALHARGFSIAIETNGTQPVPLGVDWVCVSPKAGSELVVRRGNELKLVVQQEGLHPSDFESLNFDHFFLQPMDGPKQNEFEKFAVEYCLAHPRWRLSLQTHKYLGIP